MLSAKHRHEQTQAELARLGTHEQARVNGTFELPGGVREVEVEAGSQGRVARVDQDRPMRSR